MLPRFQSTATSAAKISTAEGGMPMQTKELSVKELQLCDRLRQMKLSGMADAFEAQVLDPNSDLKSFLDRISCIVNHEWELRYNKKLARFMKKATLRYPSADLDDTLYEPDRLIDTGAVEELATCRWIEEGRNLLITGATGAGKSYLANALCISALRRFHSCRYIRANTLMNEMDHAKLQDAYIPYMNGLARLDLLVIDDFGLMDLDLNKCRDLFEVIDSRDNLRSTMIVSQLPVSSWYELFADSTYADACLDRMIHKAYRLELNGKNMRNPR